MFKAKCVCTGFAAFESRKAQKCQPWACISILTSVRGVLPTEFSILQANPIGALNACINAHPIGFTMEV